MESKVINIFNRVGVQTTVMLVCISLLYPLSVHSESKNSKTPQVCYGVFSSQKTKSHRKADRTLNKLFDDSLLPVEWNKLMSDIQANEDQALLERLFSDDWKEERKKRRVITEKIIQHIGKKRSTSKTVHRLLVEQFLEISKEEETGRSEDKIWKNLFQRALIEALSNVQIRDAEILHLLVVSLEYLREGRRYFDIRRKLYKILDEALSQNVKPVKLKKETKWSLAGKIRRKNYSSEEKKQIIEILKKTKTKRILVLQWLSEGLNDPDPEVGIATAEALGEMMREEYPLLTLYVSILKLYARSLLPHVVFADEVFWIKHHVALLLENYANQFPHPHSEVQRTAVRTLNQINAWYPRITEDLTNLLSADTDGGVATELIQFLENNFTKNKIKSWLLYATRGFKGLRELKAIRNKGIKRLMELLYENKDQAVRRAASQTLNKLVKPKQYYEVQNNQVEYLARQIKDYEEKNIKTKYNNPNSSPAHTVPPPFESWFEVEVFLEIHKKGYIVLPQFSAYEERPPRNTIDSRMDLVIIDPENPDKKLAVECDGPSHREWGTQEEDIQRQKELTAEAWFFWRVKYEEQIPPFYYKSLWNESGLPRPWIHSGAFYSFSFEVDASRRDISSSWKKRQINKDSLNGLWKKLDEIGIRPYK